VRGHLHKEVRNRLDGEMPKALTNHQSTRSRASCARSSGPSPRHSRSINPIVISKQQFRACPT
jgi:protein required for attachment to host cells